MKDMRAIGMNEDPLFVIGVKSIAADMVPSVNNKHAMARGGEPLGADRACKSGAGDQETIGQAGFSLPLKIPARHTARPIRTVTRPSVKRMDTDAPVAPK